MADNKFFSTLFETPSSDVSLPQDLSLPEIKTRAPEAPKIPDISKAEVKTTRWLPPDDIRPIFEAAAKEFDVPVNVLMALGHQESRYNPNAVGQPTQWGRAKGMMQYLDDTAKGLGINPFDPAEAIPAAAKQLAERLRKGYSMEDAIKEHFAGPDRKLWGEKTAAYGREVMEKVGRIGELIGTDAKGAPSSGNDVIAEMNKAEPGRYRAATPGEIALANAREADATDPDRPKKRAEEGGIISDIGKNLKMGMNTAALDVRELVGKIPYVGKPIVDAGDAVDQYFSGKPSDQLLKQDNEQMQKSMTPDMQQALDKKWWDSEKGTFGPAWSDWRTYAGGITQSLPEQAMTMLPAMRLAKAAYGAKVAAGATQAVASQAAARTAMIAGGVAEGALGGAQSSRDVRDEVLNLKDDVLASSDAFKALTASGMNPAEARKALAEDLSTRAFVTSGVATGLFGGMGDRVIAKILTDQVGQSVVKNAVKGFAKGAIGEGLFEELPQSAAQQVAKNEAMRRADTKQSLTDDVANQALSGLALGGLQGGGMGAMAGAAGTRSASVPTTPAEPSAPVTPAAPQAKITPEATPTTVTPAAPEKSTAAGPLTRAVENAAAQPERVTVTAPEGQITGFVQSHTEDASGNSVTRVLGDDGQVYTFTSQDGVQITPEAGLLTSAIEKVAEQDAPAESEAPNISEAAPNIEQEAPNTPASAEQDQATDLAAQPEPEVAPTQDAKQAAKPEPSLEDMDEPALRARMKYIAGQAKANGGWNKMLTAERQKVEAQINKLTAKKEEIGNGRDAADLRVRDVGVQGAEAAAQSQGNQQGGSEGVGAVDGGRDSSTGTAATGTGTDVSGADTSSKPGAALTDQYAGKWFSSREKADAFIAKKKAGATHEVVQTGKDRFEVKPKAVVRDSQTTGAVADQYPDAKKMINAEAAPNEISFVAGKVEDSNGNKVDGYSAEFSNNRGGKGYIQLAEKDGRIYPVMVDNGIYQRGESSSGAVTKAYEQAISFAKQNGKRFTSDDSVTTQAARVYESLGRKGYAVQKSKSARLATPPEVISERWLTDDGSPVFTVDDQAEAAPAGAQQQTEGAYNGQGQKAEVLTDVGATGKAAPSIELVEVTDVYGVKHRVRKRDLDVGRNIMPTFTKDGKRKENGALNRGNIDITGESQKANADEVMRNPMFNIITANDDKAFKTESAAKAFATKRGFSGTHDVVPASDVQDGVSGYVLRKKLAEKTTDQAKPSTEVVRIYKTKSGKTGATVKRTVDPRGRVSYSYIGEWGAASGIDEQYMAQTEAGWKSDKRGFTIEEAGKPDTSMLPRSESQAVNDFLDGKRNTAPTVEEVAEEKAKPTNQAAENDERFERAMRAAATNDKTADGDVQTSALKYVPFDSALKIARDAVAGGVPLNPGQFHSRLDLTMASAIRLVETIRGEQSPTDPMPPNSGKNADPFANNKVFTADKVEAARARIRSKLTQLNSGLDPELMMDGMTIAGAYIEAGVRNFADYAKAMTDDFGDTIKPYLLSFYEAARNYPGIDTEGMTPIDEAKEEHSALLTPAVIEQVKEAVGTQAEKPAKRTKKTGAKSDITLTQDWGVDHVDGYGDSEREDGNSVKDAFLKETRAYLTAVAGVLTEQGYLPQKDGRGRDMKPVSVDESGVATSGEVVLTMYHPDGGGIYVSIGGSSLRGVVPTTASGIAIMFRQASEQDKYGTKSTNRWAPVDLSAADFAILADQEAKRARLAKPAASPTMEVNETKQDDTKPTQADDGTGVEGQAAVPARADEGGRDAGGNAEPAGVERGAGARGDARGAGERPEVPGDQRPAAEGAGSQQPAESGRGSGAEPGDRGNRKPRSSVANYRIQPGELKREGSWRATAERNVQIVELVKQIKSEGRQPTADERALMAKFTGWGASEIANGIFPDQYGRYKNADWQALGQRLKAALTDEEYSQAKRTTQYAHYTSEGIIRGIWGAFQRLGFAGGSFVEPGMGIGHFNGLMPDGIAANSTYTGIEYDTLTGMIAKALYPASNVIVGDYTRTNLPKDFFDAAVGNPPFSQTQVLNDPEYKNRRPMLHDYFFMKTIDRVKPGGLLVFVTSKGTMDKTSDKSRKYLGERANLLGAIRLPQTAFKDNAGTEVVTDVIFLQKRGDGIADNGVSWMNTKEVTTPQGPTAINEYFADHPEMVLGTHALAGSMYRANEYTVLPLEGDIEAHFAEAVKKLPENVTRPARGSASERALVQDRDFNPKHKKEGGLYVSDDGKLMQVESGSGVELTHRSGADGKRIALTPKQKQWLKGYIGVRDALKQAQYDQLNDGPWEKSLKALNKAYDAFVKEQGPILDFTVIERTAEDGTVTETKRLKNAPMFQTDVEGALVYALETIKEDGTIEKGAALKERVLERHRDPEIKTTQDAMFVSLNRLGSLNLDDVAALAGTDRDIIIRDLGTAIYDAPGKGYQLADEYLSGNVVRKLKEAQAAAEINPAYKRNVEALLAVQPRPLGPTEITVRLGANWVPPSDVAAFASEVLGDRMSVTYSPIVGRWSVDQHTHSVSEWSFDKMTAGEVMESVLNSRQIKVTWRDQDGKTHVDVEATEKANDIAAKMRERFRTWIWTDTKRADRLVKLYNENFNNIAPRAFDGSHLTLPGVSARFKLYPHQKRAVWRIIQQGDVYLAHAVGAGKTMEMIAAGMEERRLGLVNKPMYVVPNHMLAQFSREFLELYPAANIMVADENNFHTHNRKRFVAQAALNNPDAIIITHSAFGRIAMSDEFSSKFIQDQIDAWKEALDDVDKSDRITVKQIERRIEQLERRLEGKQGKDKKDQVLTFEELGVDKLYVDEFHEFRKLDFATNQGSVKGIDPNGSQRALDLQMKTEYLRGKNPGRALVAASGTPVTNTMGELFTAQRFFQPEQLREDGLDTFDAWSAQYGDIVTGFEQNAAGGYEMVSRFAKFQNVPELMRRVRSFMDILTSSNLGELVKRPDVIGGGREVVVTPVPEGYKEYQQELQSRIQRIRNRKGPPKKGEDIILNVIAEGRFSAIDMRFVDPTLPSDPNSKLNLWIDGIIAAYKETADYEFANKATGKPDPIKGASIIGFSDIGLGEASAANRGFDMRAWIEKRLADAGIPKEHVAFMRDHKQSAKKERLFADMRDGKRRILIGGKEMETGTNVQKRLTHLFHLDAPWFPASVEQREGRIIRQGNQNQKVKIIAYATKGSYDSTMWGLNARKARFIEQAMNGDDSVRSLEDVSEASAFEMAAALASGDERYLKLAGLKTEVERLERLRHAHYQDQNSLRRDKHWSEEIITRNEAKAKELKEAIAKRIQIRAGEFSGKVGKTTFDSREEFSQAIFKAFKKLADDNHVGDKAIAEIGGFDVVFYGAEMKGSGEYVASLHVSIPGDPDALASFPIDPDFAVAGIATRAANQVNGMDRELAGAEASITAEKRKIEQINARMGAAFPEEAILLEKVADLSALEEELAAEGEAANADAAAAAVETDGDQQAEADGEVKASRRYQTIDQRTDKPMTADELRKAIRTGATGAVIDQLVEHGTIVLHDTVKTLPKEVGKNVRGIQAVTMPDGTIHMVASAVTRENANGVLLHEMFHRGGEKLIGGAEWSKLMGRMGSLYRQSEQSTGRAREFFDKARDRVAAARKQGAVPVRMEVEEFAAYAIEEYQRAPDSLPATIRKWVEDLIGMVKAWMVKAYGKQIGQVTPAQLAAFAKLAVMDVAIERRKEVFGEIGNRLIESSFSGARYSVEPEQADAMLAEATDALQAKDDFIGGVVGDLGMASKAILHPRQIAAIFPQFTPVYRTGVSQIETRDAHVAELGKGMGAYDALPQESKEKVNKVLELGRLMSQVYSEQDLADGVSNTGSRTVVALDEKGKPTTTTVPVEAVLTGKGEAVQLSSEEIKAYNDLRVMFDRALDMMRDQTLSDMGFSGFTPMNGSKPLMIQEAGPGKIVLKGTVYTDDERAALERGEKINNPIRAIIKKFDGAKWNPALFGYEFDERQRKALEKEMDAYLKQSTAKQIMDLIDDKMPEAKADRLRNVAKFVAEIEQAKRAGYVPFARYGDYVVTVKEKIADVSFVEDDKEHLIATGLPDSFAGDMLDMGADKLTKKQGGPGWRIKKSQKRDVERLTEKTVYSEKVETGLKDIIPRRKMEKAAAAGDEEGAKIRNLPSVKSVIDKAQAEWVGDNPARRIVAFNTKEQIDDAPVNLTDVSALAELSSIDDATWNMVHEKLMDAQKAKGFRRHLIHSDNVPGYTGDFERAMADYVISMSGYLSRRQHMKRWENSVSSITEQPRLRKYAEAYRQYMNNPQEELAMVRQIGFFSYIAGVPMSALANLTQVPIMTVPTLAQVAPMPLVVKEIARAYKDAFAMVTTGNGLDMFDPSKAPADVRQALKEAWDEGSFVPLETYDLMMTARQRNVGARKGVKAFNTATQVIATSFTFAERLNRLVTFMAAARLADKRAVQENAKRVLGKDAMARTEVLRNWNAKSFAEWAVDESQYRMGKANRPTVMRGVGSSIMQFKGFMLQTFEAWYRMVALHGKDGKFAAAASIATLYAFAGLWGMPGADDLRKLLENIYKQITDKDLDLKTELRGYIARVTGSNAIAQIVNKGATYPLGLDMTRVGMGTIVPDSPLAAAGIPFDMLIGRPKRAFEKATVGNYWGAAGELSPNFMKNPLVAAGWATDGVRDKQGNRILLPSELSKANVAMKALGAQPAIVTDIRDYEYAQRRQETAVDALKRTFVNKIAKTIGEMEVAKDPEKLKKLDERLTGIYQDIADHNKTASPEQIIKIDQRTLRNKIMREMEGVKSTWGKERKAARGAADELRGTFGLKGDED